MIYIIKQLLKRLDPRNYLYVPKHSKPAFKQIKRFYGEKDLLAALRTFVIKTTHSGEFLEDELEEMGVRAWSFQSLLYNQEDFDLFIAKAKDRELIDFANFFCVLVICGNEEEPYLLNYRYVYESLVGVEMENDTNQFLIKEALDFLNVFTGEDHIDVDTLELTAILGEAAPVSLKHIDRIQNPDFSTVVYSHTQTGRIE